MDTRAIGNSNTGTVEDDADEDEDEDEDKYSTIYSCARRDPPASHKVFSNNLSSTSISGDDSHATAPCTLETMSLVYHSFDWGDDVEDAEWAGMQSTHTQPIPASTTANDAAYQLAFMKFLTQYVHQSWSQYEKQHQMQVVDKNRTLDVKKRIPGGVLSICDWKWLPLSNSYKTEAHALKRPAAGACAYDRTPIIIVTNEDVQRFRLLEVKKILTEEQVAEIRKSDTRHRKGVRKMWSGMISRTLQRSKARPERSAVQLARPKPGGQQNNRSVTPYTLTGNTPRPERSSYLSGRLNEKLMNTSKTTNDQKLDCE
jgi:hypothetical protein